MPFVWMEWVFMRNDEFQRVIIEENDSNKKKVQELTTKLLETETKLADTQRELTESKVKISTLETDLADVKKANAVPSTGFRVKK